MPSTYSPQGSTPVPIAQGGTGAVTQPAALNNLLPAQPGNAAKLLTTDANNASWQNFSGLGSNVDLALADVVPIYHGGVDANINADRLLAYFHPGICDFRLSAVNGDPVGDTGVGVTSNTLYLVPWNGNRICLWDGSRWRLYTTAQLSLSLAGVVSGNAYDVFVYDNAGTLTLELFQWTSVTARVALGSQDGILVKGSDAKRRFLGSICSGTSGVVEDSAVKRFVWNAYNRLRRPLIITDPTSTWTDNSNVWHQARANGANCVQLMCGNAYSMLDLDVTACFYASAVWVTVLTGVGEDVTNGIVNQTVCRGDSQVANGPVTFSTGRLQKFAPLGYHSYNWLLYVAPSGQTATILGTNYSGIQGLFEC